jgi:hypothetical protein
MALMTDEEMNTPTASLQEDAIVAHLAERYQDGDDAWRDAEELSSETGIPAATVSSALTNLNRWRRVSCVRKGRRNWYRVTGDEQVRTPEEVEALPKRRGKSQGGLPDPRSRTTRKNAKTKADA